MIAGHYATALIPKARAPELPIAWLLLAANFPDFVWVALGFAGIETPHPVSILDATFANIRVQMTFSHDVLPILVQSAAFAAVVLLAGRGRRLAAWCAALVVLHLGCDLVSGFEHHLWGPGSPSIGLDTYGRAPHVALLIEAMTSFACVFYYDRSCRERGRPLSRGRRLGLYGVLVGGVVVWLPTATMSLARILGLH